MNEYNVIASLCIETKEELVDTLNREIMDAIIEIVERHSSFVGGGLRFELVEEEKDNG